ncbi:MAG: permease [Clostridiaceae bacterium]|nr:permease [Clostridiaceae bacterium]
MYRHFKVSVYCTVFDLLNINDLDEFRETFSAFTKHVHVDHVYLETYRSRVRIDPNRMREFITFFTSMGIRVSGGITPTRDERLNRFGFSSLCYSDPEDLELLKDVCAMTAGIFDDFILDDFFFDNCRCERCIEQKGDLSWADFRCDRMKKISEDYVIASARKANPDVKVTIKYPNWYASYHHTGYCPEAQKDIFDFIYTGTETRDSRMTQQHLPKYLSYFLMRYMENVKPTMNLGGWFDLFECAGNPLDYSRQILLTAWSRPQSMTFFCLGMLLASEYRAFIPMAGEALSSADQILDCLGTPLGIPSYVPFASDGENYIHNFLGMRGFSFEPTPHYPADSEVVFLSECAAKDPLIIECICQSLNKGADVVCTSGLVARIQDKGWKSISSMTVSNRHLSTNIFASAENALAYGPYAIANSHVQLPIIEYATNDEWVLSAGIGQETSAPIVIGVNYGRGRLFVFNVPEDFGQIYSLPEAVIEPLREALAVNDVAMACEGKFSVFAYDSDVLLVHSYSEKYESLYPATVKKSVKFSVPEVSGESSVRRNAVEQEVKFPMVVAPGSTHIFKLTREKGID